MISLLDAETREQLQALVTQRDELFVELAQSPAGSAWCREHTQLFDQAINLISRKLRTVYPEPHFAIVATGGYGRMELAPHSDIDLCVVPLVEEGPSHDAALRALHRALHEAIATIFKVDIGYAYRLINDLSGLDPKSRTGLLDGRLVAGSQRAFSILSQQLWETMNPGEFILAKIKERTIAEQRYGNSPSLVEPHLKESAGGLRSFQSGAWIRAAIGERISHSNPAYETLLKVRNQLHLVSRRKMDQLNRSRQNEIAETFGESRDEMMNSVLRSLQVGQSEYELSLERLKEARYPLADGVTVIKGEARVQSFADPGQAAVGIAIATNLGLSVPETPIVLNSHFNGPAILFAVSGGEKVLRNLDRAGVLDFLLPELTRCRTLVPPDPIHSFTVFEHTLQLIRNLDNTQSIRWLDEFKQSLNDLEPLYLAGLLHDIGKFESHHQGLDHSTVGAELAKIICQRWHLDRQLTDDVEWLVREHLTLAFFLRMRDLQNPQSVVELAAIVQNRERLFALALLTYADISALSEGSFTSSQEVQLRELVMKTAAYFDAQADDSRLPDSAERNLTRLRRALRSDETDEEETARFVETLPAYYLISTPSETVKIHYQYYRQAKDGFPTINLKQVHELSVSEITICTPDRHGLLSDVLGVLYAFDISVQGLSAGTTNESPGIAIDTLTVAFNGKPIPQGTWRQLSQKLDKTLTSSIDVSELLVEKGKDPTRVQKVNEWRLIDSVPPIVEILSPSGRGLPYRLTKALTAQNLNILSARLGQWAGAAGCAFYLENMAEPEQLRSRLELALSR